MRTIRYSKVDTGDIEFGNNLEEFIDDIRDELDNNNMTRVILEPGDATRYQLILMHCPGHIMMFNENSYHCFYFTAYTIENPGGNHQGINPWTNGLMRDLTRLIFGNKTVEPMYNWEKGCPIINGQDAR